MPDSSNPITLGLLLVAAYTMVRFLDFGLNYFLKRIARDNYVTTEQCGQCRISRVQNDAKFDEFKKEVRESFGLVKGVLVVLAAGKQISLDELKELMR
jgi:hypothetical protein